ncbi:MAG: glutathione peroxidase [Flavobacteriaceae bacterium]|nr:glutathione peroxidase [Bacteroidia bacterium]NNK88508.1 glutathione peroxidase [Flavobacteriaceae bacterium]
MNPIKTFFKTLAVNPSTDDMLEEQSLYDIELNAINGNSITLADFKGRHVLFVNVASKCGFTPQYKELQKLHEEYKDRLVVIGLPCNQFGNQEPGDGDQIQSFCEMNYGVDFLLTEKVDVKGRNQHPLYRWLTTAALNGRKSSNVKWNFQKYLVDGEGKLVDYYYSMTSPMSKKITKHLN